MKWFLTTYKMFFQIFKKFTSKAIIIYIFIYIVCLLSIERPRKQWYLSIRSDRLEEFAAAVWLIDRWLWLTFDKLKWIQTRDTQAFLSLFRVGLISVRIVPIILGLKHLWTNRRVFQHPKSRLNLSINKVMVAVWGLLPLLAVSVQGL